MPIGTIVFWGFVAIAIVYAVTIYNGLVALKHNVSRNFANIDVLLKQRHDELPKLIDTCKRYMGYEQETLARVIEARNSVASARDRGDIPALGEAETALRAGVGQLFALAENYPELKADETFRHLQGRISGLESSIADRREVYNESVNNNNIRIEQLPDNLIARPFGFKAFDLLKFDAAEKRDVDVGALFKS